MGNVCVSHETFGLAIVDGLHSRSCTQKLGDSGEQRKKRASKPTWMLFVEARSSQLPSDHETLRHSQLAGVSTETLRRDRILIAVIKSIARFSETFESNSDAHFGEARISFICRVMESGGFLQSAAEATYRRFICETRLVPVYQKTLQLVENGNDRAAAGDDADENSRMGITHLKSVPLL